MLQDLTPEIVELIFADAGDSTERAVLALRNRAGLKHVTYHGARLGAKAVDNPFIKTTYDAEWVKRYLIRGYVLVDPIVREGFSRTLPFRWDDISLQGEREAQFFADAMKFGIDPNGLTIPIRDKDNRRATLSVASELSGLQWGHYCRQNLLLLSEIARGIHEIAVAEQGEKVSRPALSPRELEVLQWTTHGKTVAEIGVILHLREHTVAAYMRSARYKLNAATIAQAVSTAIKTGLISDELPKTG